MHKCITESDQSVKVSQNRGSCMSLVETTALSLKALGVCVKLSPAPPPRNKNPIIVVFMGAPGTV